MSFNIGNVSVDVGPDLGSLATLYLNAWVEEQDGTITVKHFSGGEVVVDATFTDAVSDLDDGTLYAPVWNAVDVSADPVVVRARSATGGCCGKS